MASSLASGPVSVRCNRVHWFFCFSKVFLLTLLSTGVLDREGNARKVVNCSCVVVKDWGEESQERSVIMNYFQSAE